MEKLDNRLKIYIYATILLLIITLPIVYCVNSYFLKLGYFDNISTFIIWNIFLYIIGYVLEHNYLIFIRRYFINK